MSLERYLDHFQRLIGRYIKKLSDNSFDESDLEPMRGYVCDLDIAIDAYTETWNHHRDQVKKWDLKINQLVRLRDQIQSLIDKETKNAK